ncbi:flagellar protein FlaG [Thalassotalea fusca]
MTTQIAIDKSTNGQSIEFGRTSVVQPTDDTQAHRIAKEKEQLTKVQRQEETRLNQEKKQQEQAEAKVSEPLASEIEDAIETITEFMSLPLRSVNFKQDDGSDKTIIKVFDADTKELIKQFPSDEVLEIAQRIVELRQDVDRKTGILLDEKV